MTREQLTAMRDAAKERAEDFERKSQQMHSARQFETARSIGVSYSIAVILTEMYNAALKVTP